MKTQAIQLEQSSELNKIEIVDFYNSATEDYKFWSADYNMHFGFFIPFKTNPFKRDSMLNQMNHQVLRRLNIGKQKHRLMDLGCGMGATMRYALNAHNNLIAYGTTLSDFQLQHGNTLLKGKNGVIIKEDYHNISLHSNSFDSAIAIESFCHSGHNIMALREAYRILKPGGRLVIADVLLKKNPNSLSKSAQLSYRRLCDHWSLEKIGTKSQLNNHLMAIGFKDIQIEDISFKVAPSVLHVPFAILGFIMKKITHFKPIKRESIHNVKGSFFALMAGLHLKGFGYYLITATK